MRYGVQVLRFHLFLLLISLASIRVAKAQDDWSLHRPRRSHQRRSPKRTQDTAPRVTSTQSATRDKSEQERALALAALDRGDAVSARELWPDSSTGGLLELARLMADRELLQSALEIYDQVLEKRNAIPHRASLLLEVSRLELRAGDYESAFSHLQEVEQRGALDLGQRSELWELRYQAQRALGQLDQYVKAATHAGLHDAAHQRRLAAAYETLGDLRAAIKALRRASALQPQARENLQDLVALLLRAGDEPGALAAYDRWLARFPADAPSFLERAHLQIQAGQRQEAIAGLRRAVSKLHDETSLLQVYEELVSLGDEQGSQTALERLIQRNPRNTQALLLFAEHKLRTGRRNEALSLLPRVLAEAHDRAQAHQRIADLLSRHGLVVDACSHYEAAFKLRAQDPSAEQALASALVRCHRGQDALAHLHHLVQRSDLSPMQRRLARRELVALWAMQGDLPREVLRLERLFGFDATRMVFDPNVEPDRSAGRLLVEAYLYRLRHPSRTTIDYAAAAEAVLTRLVALERNNHAHKSVETLLALERLRVARNDQAGAIEVLQSLLQADPAHAGAYLQRLSERCQAMYRDEDALRYAQEHEKLAPSDAAAVVRVAQLYEAQGDEDAAIRAYERAVALEPDRHNARWALAKLLVFRDRVAEGQRHLLSLLATIHEPLLFTDASRLASEVAAKSASFDEVERVLLQRISDTNVAVYARKALLRLYRAEFGSVVADEGMPPRVLQTDRARAVAHRALRPMLDALASTDPEEQDLALGLLQRLTPPGAAAALLAYAQRPGNIELRKASLFALLHMVRAEHAEGLIALATGPELRLRALAARGLALLAQEAPLDAKSAQTELLRSSTPKVRCMGSFALTSHDHEAWFKQRLDLLQHDENALVRSCAAISLARPNQTSSPTTSTATPRSLELAAAALATAAQQHPGLERSIMLNALAMLASPAALRALAPWQVLGELSWITQQDSTWTSPGDLYALPKPGFGLRELSQFAQQHAQATWHRSEIFARVRREALLQALDGNASQRRAALQTLLLDLPSRQASEDDALARAIVEQLAHPEPAVRALAGRWLALGASSHEAPQLARALGDADVNVRTAILLALAQRVQLPQSQELLAELQRVALDDHHWAVRKLAATVLDRVGQPAEAVLAHMAVRDTHAWVRQAAVLGLTRNVSAVTTAALVDVVRNDQDIVVKTAAADALRTRGVDVGVVAENGRPARKVRKQRQSNH